MFQYLKDPLFLISIFAYSINRFLFKPAMPSDEIFFTGYFNDIFLIPCALPPLLFLHRKIGLRGHDKPPTWRETALHLAIWCVILELVGPWFYEKATGDIWDVLAYCAGALAAWLFWNRSRFAAEEHVSLRPPVGP